MMTMNNRASAKGPYELALKVIRRKRADFAQAGTLLEQAHEQGDARATYALATWSLSGNEGYPKDLRKAVKLLKLAATADVAAAHFDLAVSYETGQGTRTDQKAAYRHFLAAALCGDSDAFAEVGRCHYHGIGVARDRRVAEVWLRRAEIMNVEVR
jgi:TPR repeat protein